MIKKYSVVLWCLLGFIAIPCSFASLQTQLSSFHNLSAEFTQSLTDQQGHTRTSSGKVWILKPNQFRWQVNTPNKQLFVSDGQQLWHYEVDLQQVTVQPLSTQISQMPLLLLSGEVSNLDTLFTITALGDECYQLVPKEQDSIIKKIILQFHHNTLQQLQLTNTMGQISAIHFSKVKTNTCLSPSLFQFTPPKGVDVVR